jgi:hypothetical protein
MKLFLKFRMTLQRLSWCLCSVPEGSEVESWIATAHANDVFLSNDVISEARARKPGTGTPGIPGPGRDIDGR